MKYFVSRQRYWPDGDLVVEIAKGGLDYANPDMLSAIWYASGEGEEYYDPRAALTAAFQVRSLWKMVEKEQEVRIEVGYTGGYTMPFCDHPTDEELVEWARAEYGSLPKCDRCGELLDDPKKAYYIPEFGSEDRYCSEHCASIAWDDFQRELYQDELDEMRDMVHRLTQFMEDTPDPEHENSPEWWAGDMPGYPELWEPDDWNNGNKTIRQVWEEYLADLEKTEIPELVAYAEKGRAIPWLEDLLSFSDPEVRYGR